MSDGDDWKVWEVGLECDEGFGDKLALMLLPAADVPIVTRAILQLQIVR